MVLTTNPSARKKTANPMTKSILDCPRRDPTRTEPGRPVAFGVDPITTHPTTSQTASEMASSPTTYLIPDRTFASRM